MRPFERRAQRLGRLSDDRMREVCTALDVAVDCQLTPARCRVVGGRLARSLRRATNWETPCSTHSGQGRVEKRALVLGSAETRGHFARTTP